MLLGVSATFDFYGAGVSRMHPGGGPPMLELLEQVQVRLTCICGRVDSLTPQHDRHAIESALKKTTICTRGSDILNTTVPSKALCVKSTVALTLMPHPRVKALDRGVIKPAGQPLWRRLIVGVQGWYGSLGARLNPCRLFSRGGSCVASGT